MSEQKPEEYSEIFQTHAELSRDEREWTAPLLKLLGGSVLAHVVLLAALAYVPALRDTFIFAGALASLRVVSEEYEKTRVDYERATVINLAAQQLYYPAGYLADQTALPNPNDPMFVASVNPTPLPVIKPVPTPSPTPSPSPSASPSPADAEQVAGADKGGQAAGDEKAGADASPTPAAPQTPEEAERRLKEAGGEKLPQLNTRPFEDLLKRGKEMRDRKEISLEETMEVTVEADRQENGKLTNIVFDPEKKLTDPKIRELAADFVAAISDSGALLPLAGTKHLVMKVKLDKERVDVRIVSDMASEAEASRRADIYGLLILGGSLDAKRKQKDEAQIFDSTKVASEGKQIVLTFQMARKDVGDLLSKFLKKNEQQPTPTPAT